MECQELRLLKEVARAFGLGGKNIPYPKLEIVLASSTYSFSVLAAGLGVGVGEGW
jgi:hypothetical protein